MIQTTTSVYVERHGHLSEACVLQEESTLVPKFHVATRGTNQEVEAADLATGGVKL